MEIENITFLELFLIKLDATPWNVLWRVVLGFYIPSIIRLVAGGSGSVLFSVSIFFALLVALRVVPAVLRHVLHFSPDATEVWRRRRRIGKLYDCYQWQKLFWLGLGMLPHSFGVGDFRFAISLLVIFCLGLGGVGLFGWTALCVRGLPKDDGMLKLIS